MILSMLAKRVILTIGVLLISVKSGHLQPSPQEYMDTVKYYENVADLLDDAKMYLSDQAVRKTAGSDVNNNMNIIRQELLWTGAKGYLVGAR